LDYNPLVILILSGLIIFLLYGVYRAFSKQPSKPVTENTTTILEKQVQKTPEPTIGVIEPPVAEPIQKLEEPIKKTEEAVQKQPESETIVSDTSHPASVTEVIETAPGPIIEELPSVQAANSKVVESEEKLPVVEKVSRRKKKPTTIDRTLNINKIEGIGPEYAKKLIESGIKTTGDLLESGHTKSGRVKLAEVTGISQKLILEWVNLADLFRISGIGEEYSDLLEEAGVDTVIELARRNPENLLAKLTEVNDEKKLVRRIPNLAKVEDWIKQAKELPRKVEY
jgi:predicted flap endonuclease-1-like 5' DNA nuclease